MGKLLLSVALALAAFGAQAQIKCWNDAGGKRVCGDVPPPGAKVTTLKGPATPEPAPAAKGAKDDKKGPPLTPAEREQEARKRQAEAQKAAAKAEEARKDAESTRENCARANESVRTYESGGRIMRTDAKGERYYLDDAQIAQELSKARQDVQQWCK
jgi:hypothetical protein